MFVVKDLVKRYGWDGLEFVILGVFPKNPDGMDHCEEETVDAWKCTLKVKKGMNRIRGGKAAMKKYIEKKAEKKKNKKTTNNNNKNSNNNNTTNNNNSNDISNSDSSLYSSDSELD